MDQAIVPSNASEYGLPWRSLWPIVRRSYRTFYRKDRHPNVNGRRISIFGAHLEMALEDHRGLVL
jgi:hypothetical protein